MINKIHAIPVPPELKEFEHLIAEVEDLREQGGRVVIRLKPGFQDIQARRHFVRALDFNTCVYRFKTKVGKCHCSQCDTRTRQHRTVN